MWQQKNRTEALLIFFFFHGSGFIVSLSYFFSAFNHHIHTQVFIVKFRTDISPYGAKAQKMATKKPSVLRAFC
jgi:hypothetical protein